MSDKLSKTLVLYVFNPPSKYTCSECCYYIGGKCNQYTLQDENVSKVGSCNLWEYNKENTLKLTGPHSRTKESTGYMENSTGFGCRRCEYFIADTQHCKEVSETGSPIPEKISAWGCCNNWQKDTIRGNLTDEEFKNLKAFKVK